MAETVLVEKISEGEFEDLVASFELDLIAVFSLMYEDSIKLLNRAVDEGWSGDHFIEELDKIL